MHDTKTLWVMLENKRRGKTLYVSERTFGHILYAHVGNLQHYLLTNGSIQHQANNCEPPQAVLLGRRRHLYPPPFEISLPLYI